MAEITASMVKELREKTDAPMMECKKALTEAGGDLARAEEILRVKLGNKAGKAASRVTAEGIVGVHLSSDGRTAAIVEVNCETDFVAKNDDFQAFAKALAARVADGAPADVAALSAMPLDGGTVESRRTELIGKIGENMSADIVARMVEGTVAKYLKEVTLLGQPFVKDDKQTVEQLLKARGARVHAFTLYVVGEGIEKKQTDFAAEVAAQAAAASGR